MHSLGGRANTIRAPNTTPGNPQARMKAARRGFSERSRQWRIVAPMPRATLATLWVARARGKLSPKRINTGSCTSPAPPPARAESRLATREATNTPTCSRGSVGVIALAGAMWGPQLPNATWQAAFSNCAWAARAGSRPLSSPFWQSPVASKGVSPVAAVKLML